MINLLIGPPGGGKSYEAVVYHVLPALAAGRKVITNLPLDVERLRLIDPEYPALVQFVDNRRGVLPAQPRRSFFGRVPDRNDSPPEEGIIRAFQTMADYADTWRHPDTGSGPLYVIDECHLALPRGNTSIEVEEWFSLHRHESADVLLITQSYGKVSRSVVDLVQVCYRVKKATAFGSAKKYIRKVQDGVRGDVVNTSIREYQKRYFGLYKSHTRGGGAELAANDITPIWKRWPFVGAAVMLCFAVLIFSMIGTVDPMKVGQPKAVSPRPVKETQKVVQAETQSIAEKAEEVGPHPYTGKTLHVLGSMAGRGKVFYILTVAQNGQRVHDVSAADLERLGYKVEPGTDCAVRLSHGKWSQWVICDAPSVSVVAAGAPVSSSGGVGASPAPVDSSGVVIGASAS